MTGRVASVNPKPCGAIDTGKGGYIWKWQATGNGQLTVTTCGYMSSGDSVISVLSSATSAGDTFTCLAVNDDYTSDSTCTATIASPSKLTVTYPYLRVADPAGGQVKRACDGLMLEVRANGWDWEENVDVELASTAALVAALNQRYSQPWGCAAASSSSSSSKVCSASCTTR
ncbi:hypothetical protein COHA_005140 [Chlorella ohadii]|uniref:Uncharacterized protein n=1 Tax=Chlorella ohadii TaxID=2649997 RepID=A0AAD5H1X9_9CHLO|nr:hypothetical protein COHA_005140 [Chlorella ohadii]